MAWQVGNVERAKLKNQGLLLDESSTESDKFDIASSSNKVSASAVKSKESSEKGPDKGYILKLLQQSISENVAKSSKKHPTPILTLKGSSNSPSSSQPQGQNKKACVHPSLKEQVCKEALASAGNCKIKNCPSNLQHSFPKQFLEKLKTEFCLKYLNTKVCDKNFPPHFCPHIQHCYDAGPLVKFYKDFYNRVIKKCQNCQLKEEGAASKKVSAVSKEAEPPKKSAEIKSAPS